MHHTKKQHEIYCITEESIYIFTKKFLYNNLNNIDKYKNILKLLIINKYIKLQIPWISTIITKKLS